MYDRSMRYETVLLVGGGIDVLISSVRATFEAATEALKSYLTGHSEPREHTYYAAQTDNVCRGLAAY